MPDYGHEMRFGTFLTPLAAPTGQVVELAKLTEQVGLDLVTIQDHPYQPRFLETWTLLSVIAAQTERVHVAPSVVNLPLRQPVVLARSVASLDILSGGRVELGLGAGAFAEAVSAIGGPTLTVGERIDGLAEAIRIIREVWTPEGGGIRLPGQHYRVVGAKRGPAPAHDVEIWVGAAKPRMLRLIGQLADGWIPGGGHSLLDRLPELNATIDQAAIEAGRRPEDIRRMFNVSGNFDAKGNGFLQGPPRVWAEQLAELALSQGMSGFILASDEPDDIRRFAEVAPAVREAVAAARASDPSPPADTTTAPTSTRQGVAGSGGLGVTPTPDDGVRLSDERPWDESARPSAPASEPGRSYTEAQRSGPRRLIEVHNHLRAELSQVRDLIEQVADSAIEPGAARSQINTMTMRQNNWTLGTYCETYCRLVTTHHTLEDQVLFSKLRWADPRLKPVIDRLTEEHQVIHEILEQVDRALVALATNPDDIAPLRAAVDLLSDALLSHLSYEERELTEPMAALNVI